MIGIQETPVNVSLGEGQGPCVFAFEALSPTRLWLPFRVVHHNAKHCFRKCTYFLCIMLTAETAIS